jgi:hypothetical protein
VPAESSWAKVIGIIAIVLGSLGILGGVYGVITPRLLGFFESLMPPGQDGGFEALEQHAGWTVATSLVGMAVAALLLVGGIGLAKRRPWSLATCRVWSVLKIVLVVANSAIAYRLVQTQFAAMGQGGLVAMPMGAGFGKTMAIIAVVMGPAWGWAFPVFLLIWLGRGKIKAETSGWH